MLISPSHYSPALILVLSAFLAISLPAQDTSSAQQIRQDTLLARQLQDSANVSAVAQQYEEAMQFLDAAGALYERALGKNSKWYAQLLLRQGQLFNLQGQVDPAMEKVKAALDLLPGISEEKRSLEALIYYTLGECYREQQRYDQAILYQEKALAIWLVVLGEDHENIPHVCNNIAVVYQMTGDYERALEYYEKALKISERIFGEEDYDVQLAYNNIGGIYAQLGKYDQALPYLEKALDIAKKILGEEHAEVAEIYLRLATAYADSGSYDDALSLAQQANEIMIKAFGETHPKVAEGYGLTGGILCVKGDYEAALPFYEKSLLANGYQPDQFGHVLNLNNLIHTLQALGRTYLALYQKNATTPWLNKARQYLLAGAEAADTLRNRFTEGSSRQVFVQNNYAVYEDILKTEHLLFQQTASSAYLKEAYQYASLVKSQLLYEALQEANALHFAGIPDSLLQEEYHLRLDITQNEERKEEILNAALPGTDSEILAVNATLINLKQDYESLKKRFISDYPDYYRLKYDRNAISAAEVQRELLQPGQALLEYFAGDSSIFIFVLRPDTLVMEEVKKDFPLEDWVRSLRENIYRNRASGAAAYVDAALNLYQKLVAPVRPLLTGQVLIIPDGILGYLPFEALLTSRPERAVRFNTHPYLLKELQISYCYSVNLLREMQQKKAAGKPAGTLLAVAPFYSGDTTLLAGLFAYEPNTRKDLAPLEHSGEEVYLISKLWKGQMLTGPQATEKNFTEQAGNFRILHLATHGRADERVGDHSFLAFSEIRDSMENELLFVRDLYNLRLNADLVVLSACETGLGNLSRGEGIISMARAFAYAGAKSIVTTLWSVDDAKTKDLMVDFYRKLKKGLPKDAALRQAKLDYLQRQSTAADAHPFYWAGFAPVGDMKALPGRGVNE